jgi:hypothetical protein
LTDPDNEGADVSDIWQALAADHWFTDSLDKVGTPKFKHRCASCEWLGGYLFEDDDYDLYVCHTPNGDNITIRHGNQPLEVWVGPLAELRYSATHFTQDDGIAHPITVAINRYDQRKGGNH